MRSWDLNGAVAKLELALKALQTANREVAELWSDDTNRQFQATYVDPIEPRVKSLLAAVHRLAQVLSSAEQQCQDRS